MLGIIDFEPILEDQFCFLGGSSQFRMPIDVAEDKTALAKRCRQFSSSVIRFTTSGADVCALT